MRKKSEIGGGGVIQFSNYTPPNPTSPPYPIKNERSLRMTFSSFNHHANLTQLESDTLFSLNFARIKFHEKS